MIIIPNECNTRDNILFMHLYFFLFLALHFTPDRYSKSECKKFKRTNLYYGKFFNELISFSKREARNENVLFCHGCEWGNFQLLIYGRITLVFKLSQDKKLASSKNFALAFLLTVHKVRSY